MPAKGDPGAYICQRLKPGDVVVDAGANVGAYTKQFANVVGPYGKVYAIEPDPRCHVDLYGIAQPHVVVVPSACGETFHGIATLHQGQETQQSSRYREAVTQRVAAINVAIVPLDSVTIRPVAAVKVDVQGGESAVLRGAPRLLRECPLWVIELWPWGLEKAGETPESVIDPFLEAGLYPRYLSDEDPLPTRDDLLSYLHNTESPNQHINLAWVRA